MIKIALLADIHANLPALQAVSDEIAKWNPVEVFVLGDAINRGPRPQSCLQFLLQKRQKEGWQILRGNHEEYVLQFEGDDAPKSGPLFEILRFVYWTHQKLTREEIEEVRRLPKQIDHPLNTGQHLRAVHASMAGMRAGIYPHTPQEKLPEMIQPAPDILCVGHTHNPLVRQVKRTKIVNAGSVGLPFDGDPRPCFVQLRASASEAEFNIRRITYDRQRAMQDFYDTNFLAEGGPMAKIVLEELLSAQPLISHWNQRYERAVLDEEMTLEESVDRFLNEIHDEPSQGISKHS